MLAGAFATVLLHSPVLIEPQWWLGVCCLFGCTGVPVGFIPALMATRRDPWMGAGSGFAVAFLAVGLGAAAMAIAAFARRFTISAEFLEQLRETMRKDGNLSDADITRALDALQDAAPFVPVVSAGLLALSAGVCGAIVAALAGRRPRHPYWPASGPPPGQPPA